VLYPGLPIAIIIVAIGMDELAVSAEFIMLK
jgi:hypothetical protein